MSENFIVNNSNKYFMFFMKQCFCFLFIIFRKFNHNRSYYRMHTYLLNMKKVATGKLYQIIIKKKNINMKCNMQPVIKNRKQIKKHEKLITPSDIEFKFNEIS